MNRPFNPIGKPVSPVSGSQAGVSSVPLSGTPATSLMTCPDCDGFGEVEMLALDACRPAIVECDTCEGAGEVPATCGTCEGPLNEGFCTACDDFGWPEDVRAQFARLFNPPILEAGVIVLPDGSNRVEF